MFDTGVSEDWTPEDGGVVAAGSLPQQGPDLCSIGRNLNIGTSPPSPPPLCRLGTSSNTRGQRFPRHHLCHPPTWRAGTSAMALMGDEAWRVARVQVM